MVTADIDFATFSIQDKLKVILGIIIGAKITLHNINFRDPNAQSDN